MYNSSVFEGGKDKKDIKKLESKNIHVAILIFK